MMSVSQDLSSFETPEPLKLYINFRCPLTKVLISLGLGKKCTGSGKYILRLNFNFAAGNLALLLLGMLRDATRQSSDGKSG
jgi:hypothetical protein